MSGLISLLFLLIFIFIWCYPVLKRQKKLGGYVDKKTEGKALLFGLIPTTAVLLLCQFALGWIFKLTGLNNYKVFICFLNAFLMYGMIEEATKYGFARLVLRKFERLKKIDIMIIFGFVGMGYEIAETLLIGGLFAGIGRGIFVAHIMYQFIMGHFFYESIHAKNRGDDKGAKKNMIFSLAIPMLLHGINDLFCELISVFTDMGRNTGLPDVSAVSQILVSQGVSLIVCLAVLVFTNVFCLVWGLKLAKKDADVEVNKVVQKTGNGYDI